MSWSERQTLRITDAHTVGQSDSCYLSINLLNFLIGLLLNEGHHVLDLLNTHTHTQSESSIFTVMSMFYNTCLYNPIYV